MIGIKEKSLGLKEATVCQRAYIHFTAISAQPGTGLIYGVILGPKKKWKKHSVGHSLVRATRAQVCCVRVRVCAAAAGSRAKKDVEKKEPNKRTNG